MSLLDWNSMVNSRHGMTFSLKGPYKFIPSLLSRTDCRPLQNSRSTPASNKDVVLSGIIPHLQFTLEIQSNNLTYQGNTYTKYQQFLYDLCKQLHDKSYGYRRIAKIKF